MSTVLADFQRYNANSRDVNSGDCVKRALCIAYSMDYDDVSKELNQIKRRMGKSQFNIKPVFEEFMRRRGDKFEPCNDGKSVAEFCEDNQNGVYILLVGKTDKAVTHMAAVVNGTLYDSWDSQSWRIAEISKVSGARNDTYEVSKDEMKPNLDEFMIEVLNHLQDKCPSCMTLEVGRDFNIGTQDQYTYDKYIYCLLGDAPRYSQYRSNVRILYQLTIKLNPRLSAEENIQNLQKKIKQKLYDWVYNIKKDIKDAEQAEHIRVNPKYHGDPKDLMKFPEWARSKITYFIDAEHEYGSRYAMYKYEVEMDADENDPRAEQAPTVYMRADTLTDIKYQMKSYKENFSREGYDY